MESKRKNTDYLKNEDQKVILELNKVIEKLEKSKRRGSSEKKQRRYIGLSALNKSRFSSESRSRDSLNHSSRSHQRWMNKLNEYSSRNSSWRRSNNNLPPQSP